MWWNEMHPLQNVCFVIGCAALLFMIVQIVLMLIGFDEDDAFSGDVEADMDFDSINSEGMTHLGLNLISLRSIIAFLCLGSFGIMFFVYIVPIWAAVLIGLAIGAIAGTLMALAINAMNKLQSSGNLEIKNCVGKVGDVYLTIPASRGGQGKVNIYVQERLAEFEAVTDCETPIKTGAQVKVVSVVNEGLLMVQPYTLAD